jgi:hypothetical protein
VIKTTVNVYTYFPLVFFETVDRNKNIRDQQMGITEFKRVTNLELRTNFVKDERGVFADSCKILSR